jgi:hypothetical protein
LAAGSRKKKKAKDKSKRHKDKTKDKNVPEFMLHSLYFTQVSHRIFREKSPCEIARHCEEHCDEAIPIIAGEHVFSLSRSGLLRGVYPERSVGLAMTLWWKLEYFIFQLPASSFQLPSFPNSRPPTPDSQA